MWYWLEVYILVSLAVALPFVVLYVTGLVVMLIVTPVRASVRVLKSLFSSRSRPSASPPTVISRKAA